MHLHLDHLLRETPACMVVSGIAHSGTVHLYRVIWQPHCCSIDTLINLLLVDEIVELGD